jgi:protein TonB
MTHVDPTPAAQVLATTAPMARFTIAIGSEPDAYGAVSSAATPPAPVGDAEPIPEERVDGKARLAFGLSPTYPADARAHGVEGDVRLELIVGASGLVESALVVQGVAPPLDQAALAAAKRFRFEPATRSGHPVRVRMRWSIQFRFVQ